MDGEDWQVATKKGSRRRSRKEPQPEVSQAVNDHGKKVPFVLMQRILIQRCIHLFYFLCLICLFFAGKSAKNKKKGPARKQDINRKGNEKLGVSDMDAFITEDKPETATESKAEDVTSVDGGVREVVLSSPREPEPVKAQAEGVKPVPAAKESVAPLPPQAPSENDEPARSEKPAVGAHVAVSGAKPAEAAQTLEERSPEPEAPAAEVNSQEKNEVSPEVTPEQQPEESQSPVQEDSDDAEETAKPKLKYNYKEDQWSPINVEGKKQYDRDFLLQLRKDPLSSERPANLPNMDIVKDKSMRGDRMMGMQKMGGAPDWMPSYVKSTPSKGGGIPKRGSQQGNKRDGGPKKGPIIISGLSIQENVELNKAENAWKPTVKKKVTGELNGGDDDPMAEIAKKARSILNKLTPQKFDKLVETFNELPIDNEEKLRLCMELVFEKAVDEPGFSVAYAKMCEVLKQKQVTTPDNEPISFRKVLIMRCQREFEKDYLAKEDKEKYERDMAEATTEERKKELKAAFGEKERLARGRSLGNIRFIGELYKLKMLTARIMHECVTRLLNYKEEEAMEEALECLCRLLTTVGKDLEVETENLIAVGLTSAKTYQASTL